MWQFMFYGMLNLLSIMLMMLFVMVGIAYLTLLERKLLSYIQMRKGPNKVSLLGLLQPISDGVKLFSKEFFFIYKSNYMIYLFSPIILFLMMMLCWVMKSWFTNIYYLNYSLLFMMIVLSLMGYMILMMGWSSNSIYSLIGSIRLIVQNLSYEVGFMMIILFLMMMSESYSFMVFYKMQKYCVYMIYLFSMFLIFWVSILIELNRSPMDFIEGESELVSGFNIEYFSSGFSLIFMAEYGMIIFFMYLLVMMFLGGLSMIWLILSLNMMLFMVVSMRSLLPRMRYDELMMMCWKIILPMVLNYLIFILGVKILINLILI